MAVELTRAVLLLRTARHLRAGQLFHRIRLRGQRTLVHYFPTGAERLFTVDRPSEVGWPEDYRTIDAKLRWPSCSELESGQITLLGQARQWGDPPDWRPDGSEQLWRYHLHYWDWASGLLHEADRLRARAVFARLFRSWQQQTRIGQGDEWSPYVAALRAWSWCSQFGDLARDSSFEDEYVHLLAVHARYLQVNLELDVGGNHLIKDLKALVGLAVFLHDEPLLARSLRRLERETSRQLLADGGHFERAPAYHCQVLADLLDLEALLGARCPDWVTQAVHRMRLWLGLVLLPDGSVPLLNDGFPVPSALVDALSPGPGAGEGITVLAQTGLAVLRRGPLHVVADAGLPCPDELPAHAHADTLGFVLYSGTTRVVGEAGTSTYAPGPIRNYERGTSAHSTVEVDGVDSTEVWGAFRAARRARPTILETTDEKETSVFSASHDGYTRLPGRPVHTRTWTLDASELRVLDVVRGSGRHDVVVRFHAAPTAVVATAPPGLVERTGSVALGWNHRDPATVLEHSARTMLPWRHEAVLTARGDG